LGVEVGQRRRWRQFTHGRRFTFSNMAVSS
jgi:hypothetical protein